VNANGKGVVRRDLDGRENAKEENGKKGKKAQVLTVPTLHEVKRQDGGKRGGLGD